MSGRMRLWARPARIVAWGALLAWSAAAGILWLAPDLLRSPAGIPVGRSIASPPLVAGPFELTDQDGRRVGDRDLAGHPYLMFFGYTHCPDVCPTTLAWITELLDEMGPGGSNLRVVFVSVDPARDTPAVLKDYLSAFDPRFIGLSGSREDLQPLIDRWGIYVRQVPTSGGDYAVDHTATIFAIGADGRFRGTLDIHDETPDANLAKLRRLAS